MDNHFWALMEKYPAPEHHHREIWGQERKLRLRRYCFYLMGYKDSEIPETEEEQVVLFQHVKYQWRSQRSGQMSLREVSDLLNVSVTTLRHYCTMDIGRDVWELQFESLIAIAPIALPHGMRMHLPDFMREWDAYGLHHWLSFGVAAPVKATLGPAIPRSMPEWAQVLKEMPSDPEVLDLFEQILKRKRFWGEPGVNWAIVNEALQSCPWTLEELDAMADALVAARKVEWGEKFFSRLNYREVRADSILEHVEMIARLLSSSVPNILSWIEESRLLRGASE